ncbi:hypothetical protein CGCS363_v015035 [Colletotrichum siamense]|uniref:uncharacterized protein n=1 Tax=Colletotrichum siamense TaxID=690259 RepID=UPI00187225CA|nr:uncharacterized protein CGCS363_v015035 [Colletotrichum siamense]KAF5483066.1 hypothetical protein CGCS363_v015035 [Colletotrichum siamense]
MSTDVLDTNWSLGTNRPLDRGHVEDLRQVFRRGALERRAPENRIAVLCTAEEVRRMRIDAVDANGHDAVELVAGQHRVQALREYAAETRAPTSEIWWMCELYDKERLPHSVNVALRANRRDPSLPDNHGQVWTQLASVAHGIEGITGDDPKSMDHMLAGVLRLHREKQFPTQRLTALWNHQGWRSIINRWCYARVGLETFNISHFEWIATLGIVEYWLGALDEVLGTLAILPVDERVHITALDWKRLSASLRPNCWSTNDVKRLFYTPSREAPRDRRAERLLTTLSDEAYSSLCDHISHSPKLRIPDLSRILQCSKVDIRTAICLLYHVVAWIDQDSAIAISEACADSKNKPLIRKYLSQALDKLKIAQGRELYPAIAAVRLQTLVLDFARYNLAEFNAPGAVPPVEQDVVRVNDATYNRRFQYAAWAGLLRLVRRITDADGGLLRPQWQAPDIAQYTQRQLRASTVVFNFCTSLSKLASGHDPAAITKLRWNIQRVTAHYLGDTAEMSPFYFPLMDSAPDYDEDEGEDDILCEEDVIYLRTCNEGL